MKSCENQIGPNSDYFVYTPSKTALEMFFYPLQTGHFYYEAGYSLRREAYESFLLMYVKSGNMCLEWEGQTFSFGADTFLLLDCYKPHAYACPTDCECYWCHFDGHLARPWYKNIVSRLSNLFSLPDPAAFDKLTAIYDIFALGQPIREPLLSKWLADILTLFLLFTPLTADDSDHTHIIENIITHINEHFTQNLTVERLAELAGFSQYHFIRIFKKNTGFTPHEYIINTRIASAKYLLKNTSMSVKDICFGTGFSYESVFCSTFKRHMGLTPAQYRQQSTFS